MDNLSGCSGRLLTLGPKVAGRVYFHKSAGLQRGASGRQRQRARKIDARPVTPAP